MEGQDERQGDEGVKCKEEEGEGEKKVSRRQPRTAGAIGMDEERS